MSTTNYCECDNTHEACKTVCQFCWEKGIRYQKPFTIDVMEEMLEYRPDTISLSTYYAPKEMVQDVLSEIKIKIALVECGLEEFTECEKLAFAIIVNTLK